MSMCARDRMIQVVRREWWMVFIATAAAVVVALVTSLGAAPVYTAVADISVDAASPTRVRGVVLPDDLVRISMGEEFRVGVAARIGAKPAEVADAYRVAASGSPITLMRVTYTAASQDIAERGAKAVAEELVSVYMKAVESQVRMRQECIGVCERALADIEAATRSVPLTPQDVFSRWSIETAIVDQRDALEALTSVYTYDGRVTTSVVSSSSRAMRAVFGALVLGLVAGFVLALGREQILAMRQR